MGSNKLLNGIGTVYFLTLIFGCLLAGAFCMTKASAEETAYPEYTDEQGITYIYHDRLSERPSYSELPDSFYRYYEAKLDGLETKDVVIPDRFNGIEVTEVGCNHNKKLRSLTLGIYVRSLDEVWNCSSLEQIICPAGGGSVSVSGGFSGCSSLKEIPSKVVYGRVISFSGCSNLRKIRIPCYGRTIGKDTFKGCTRLKQVEFEDIEKVKLIDREAFRDTPWYKNGLKRKHKGQLVVSHGIVWDGRDVTGDCTIQGAKMIVSQAFDGNKKLGHVKLVNVKAIGEKAFLETKMKSLTMKNVGRMGRFMLEEARMERLVSYQTGRIDAWALNNIRDVRDVSLFGVTEFEMNLEDEFEPDPVFAGCLGIRSITVKGSFTYMPLSEDEFHSSLYDSVEKITLVTSSDEEVPSFYEPIFDSKKLKHLYVKGFGREWYKREKAYIHDLNKKDRDQFFQKSLTIHVPADEVEWYRSVSKAKVITWK